MDAQDEASLLQEQCAWHMKKLKALQECDYSDAQPEDFLVAFLCLSKIHQSDKDVKKNPQSDDIYETRFKLLKESHGNAPAKDIKGIHVRVCD